MALDQREKEDRIRAMGSNAHGLGRDGLLTALSTQVQAAQDIGSQVMLGDLVAIRDLVEAEPTLVNSPTLYRGWKPLMLACVSSLLMTTEYRGDILAIVDLLLERGADVNGYVEMAEAPESRLGALYAASAVSRDVELVDKLLAAGANPDDHESLYHAVEHPNLNLIGSLVRAGAPINGRNVLHHALDIESPELIKFLLEGGGDPNDWSATQHNTPLHFAVRRGRSAEVVSLILSFGGDPVRRDGNARTAIGLAALFGRTDLLEVFKSAGHEVVLDPIERSVCEGVKPGGEFAEDVWQVLTDAAANGQTDHVLLLLTGGWDVNLKGTHGGTALHWASWHGHVETVMAILGFNPDFAVKDDAYGADAMGWASHGSQNSGGDPYNHAQVVRILIEAGMPISIPLGVSDPLVDRVLREFS